MSWETSIFFILIYSKIWWFGQFGVAKAIRKGMWKRISGKSYYKQKGKPKKNIDVETHCPPPRA